MTFVIVPSALVLQKGHKRGKDRVRVNGKGPTLSMVGPPAVMAAVMAGQPAAGSSREEFIEYLHAAKEERAAKKEEERAAKEEERAAKKDEERKAREAEKDEERKAREAEKDAPPAAPKKKKEKKGKAPAGKDPVLSPVRLLTNATPHRPLRAGAAEGAQLR